MPFGTIAGNVSTRSGDQVSIIDGYVVNASNSTTATLGSGLTFTGTGVDTTGYSQISIQVFTDQPSATNGLQAQWSKNNSNWDHIHVNTIPITTSGQGESIHLAVDAQFFRIQYTNGSIAQGTFRLSTIFNPIPSLSTIKDLDLPMQANDDVMATHSVITGVATAGPFSGQFIDVKVNPSGSIQIGGDVSIDSGFITVISGSVVSVSGNILHISGQIISPSTPSSILIGAAGSNPVPITSASGGVAISSGVIVASIVKALLLNSGDIYIGGASPYRPYSGYGFILSPGQTLPFDITNFDAIFAVTTVSGDMINFMGTD